MDNKRSVIADLRKAFTETEISSGHKAFEVVDRVEGEDSPLVIFNVKRSWALPCEVVSPMHTLRLSVQVFMAKVIFSLCGGVHVACYSGKFFGNSEFDHYPPPVSSRRYKEWLDGIVVGTLKHTEKGRVEMRKPNDRRPSLSCDKEAGD